VPAIRHGSPVGQRTSRRGTIAAVIMVPIASRGRRRQRVDPVDPDGFDAFGHECRAALETLRRKLICVHQRAGCAYAPGPSR
jgi:hypothetical protein